MITVINTSTKVLHLARTAASQTYDTSIPSVVKIQPNESHEFTWSELAGDTQLRATLLRIQQSGLVKLVDELGAAVTATQVVAASKQDVEVHAVNFSAAAFSQETFLAAAILQDNATGDVTGVNDAFYVELTTEPVSVISVEDTVGALNYTLVGAYVIFDDGDPADTVTITYSTDAATEADQFLGVVQRRGVLRYMKIVPTATVAEDLVNYASLSLVNGGATGAGTTVMATTDTSPGVTALEPLTFDLSATAAHLQVKPGDILRVETILDGTGMAVSCHACASFLCIQ